MNRLFLKYPYPTSAVILLIFAWVVTQRLARGDSLVLLVVTAVIVWPIGVFVFFYFWPQITVGGFKRAIVKRGLGGARFPSTSCTPCRIAPPSPLRAAA